MKSVEAKLIDKIYRVDCSVKNKLDFDRVDTFEPYYLQVVLSIRAAQLKDTRFTLGFQLLEFRAKQCLDSIREHNNCINSFHDDNVNAEFKILESK